MNEYNEENTPALIILLNELNLSLDQKMRQGESFENVKKIYMQIKAIESQLTMNNWQQKNEIQPNQKENQGKWM